MRKTYSRLENSNLLLIRTLNSQAKMFLFPIFFPSMSLAVSRFFTVAHFTSRFREKSPRQTLHDSTGNRIIDRVGPMHRPIRCTDDITGANLKLVTHIHRACATRSSIDFEVRSMCKHLFQFHFTYVPYGELRENIKSFR